jgi:ubiquinone/menaquinone biosynthesis C-methylase UbiE
MSHARVNFDDRLWRSYEKGRALSPQAVAGWMDAVARHVGPERPLTVLDLGSGTGRFTPSLADRFGGPVYGVEPAGRMRQVAQSSNAHPSVTYLEGRAEQIPLPAAHVDLAFLFFVLHHFVDRAAAARELARVVRTGGVVCVRTQFSDRLRDVSWRRYFPRAFEIEKAMFPTFEQTVEMFVREGFEVAALDEVETELAPSLAALVERLRHRAISTFELLSEAEVDEGLAAMERAAAVAGEEPVRELGDLLVLRRD